MLTMRHMCMTCLRSGDWSAVVTTGSEWLPSDVSSDPTKEDSVKYVFCMNIGSVMISCMCLLLITWFSTEAVSWLIHQSIDRKLIDNNFDNLSIIVDLFSRSNAKHLLILACLMWRFPSFICYHCKWNNFWGFECFSRNLKVSPLFPGNR